MSSVGTSEAGGAGGWPGSVLRAPEAMSLLRRAVRVGHAATAKFGGVPCLEEFGRLLGARRVVSVRGRLGPVMAEEAGIEALDGQASGEGGACLPEKNGLGAELNGLESGSAGGGKAGGMGRLGQQKTVLEWLELGAAGCRVTQVQGMGWRDELDMREWVSDLEAGRDPMVSALGSLWRSGNGVASRLAGAGIADGGAEVLTWARSEVGDWARWSDGRVVGSRWRAWGLGDCVYSVMRSAEDGRFVLVAGFAAPDEGEVFDTTQAVLLDVVLHMMQPTFLSVGQADLDAIEASLTPRVRVVMRKLLEGYSKKEIAAQLHVSPSTVHSHVVSIYRTLNVGSRAQLMSRLLSGRPGPREAGNPRGTTGECGIGEAAMGDGGIDRGGASGPGVGSPGFGRAGRGRSGGEVGTYSDREGA